MNRLCGLTAVAAVALLRLTGQVAAEEAQGPPRSPRRRPYRMPPADDFDKAARAAAEKVAATVTTPPSPPTILDPNVRPIDLNTALRLAGVQNPQLMIARQRVVEAAALRQLAAVQILPSINFGTNYDIAHRQLAAVQRQHPLGQPLGALRRGRVRGRSRRARCRSRASCCEGNVAVGVFGFLTSRQVVAQRQFASEAVRNQAFLQTTLAYSELLRAEGRRAVAIQVRDEAKRVAELTAAYANAGQGRQADAHRALTELESRENDVQAAEGAILVASARLCYVLNLDPSIRLHPTDAFVVPHPIVPDPIARLRADRPGAAPAARAEGAAGGDPRGAAGRSKGRRSCRSRPRS